MTAPPRPPLAALSITAFGALVGATFPLAVILAQGDIGGDLSERADDTAWIVTLYNVGTVVALPLLMSAVAAFGRRRTMIGLGAGFALTSLAIAIAPNLPWALAWRLLQGGFGGALPVMMMVMVMGSMPPGRGQMEGLTAFALSTTVGVGLSAALVVGLEAVGGWRALFWAQAGAGVLYALLARRVLHGERGNPGFLLIKDWSSYVLLSTGLGLLVVFLSEGERRFWFETWWITASLVCGLMAVGFAAVSLARAQKPLLHVAIFRKPTFSWAIVLQLVFRFGTLLAIWIAPQYLVRIAGYRVDQIALLLAPMALTTLIASPLAYWITKYRDARWSLTLGLACFALAAFIGARLTPEWALDQLILPILLAGAGQALFGIGTLKFAVHGVGPAEGPTVGVIFNYARVYGLTGGLAIASHLINEREKFHSARLVETLASVDPLITQRMLASQASYGAWTSDAAQARLAGVQSLGRAASRQAFALGYADAFTITAAALLVGALLVWALPRLPSSSTSKPS